MPHPQVIGIGAATRDHLCLVSAFPDQEGVQQAQARLSTGGGPVATALAVISSLGTSSALLDVQGDDATGRDIRSELESFGVDTRFIRIHPGARSPEATILVRQADGSRAIVFTPTSAGELSPEDLPASLFENACLLHINGRHEAACFRGIELAQKYGVTVSFDGGAGRYRGDTSAAMVTASQICIVARSFARDFCGSDDLSIQARALRHSDTQILIITDGASGSHVWNAGGDSFHQPAFTASPLIDTTGCGDVYHGAFLHHWLENRDLRAASAFASELAAKNAEGLGGRFALQRADDTPK